MQTHDTTLPREVAGRLCLVNAGSESEAEQASGPEGEGAGYLEILQNVVEEATPDATALEREARAGHPFEVCACKCDCWFCPDCCMAKGLRKRAELLPVLETFKGVYMLTLTIDPKLFSSAEAAWEYVREKRAVAETVRELKRRGVLHSERWFGVVEWQKNGMPHYHVLVDATHIPFDVICEVWNRFRPKSAGPVEGNRPGFGSVRFSAPKFKSPAHAANYATKYLLKEPEEGYPAWVLNRTNVHRVTGSRGLFGKGDAHEDETKENGVDGHDAACFCETCRVTEPAASADEAPERERSPNRTPAERMKSCKAAAVVLEVLERQTGTGERIEKRVFVGKVAIPYREVLELLDLGHYQGNSVRISGTEVAKLKARLFNRWSADEPERIAEFDEWNAECDRHEAASSSSRSLSCKEVNGGSSG